MRISNLSCRQLYTRPECMGRFYTEDFRVYTGSLRELLPSRLWISLYAESLKRSIVSRPIDFSLFWCVLSPVQKLNSTRSTLLKVDCCRNRQQIGNKVDCCKETFNFVAGFGSKSSTTWIRPLVAVDSAANTVDFVASACVPGFTEWFLADR